MGNHVMENHPSSSIRAGARSQLIKTVSLDWLGQTLASICWICSMFAYGIDSTGDWLQVMAASAWFLANVVTLLSQRQLPHE
ncbi:hypothetical protein [Pseudobacteriovorax antillogorgiicola]|uniref:hypothetical protein n=1 Tax=Pseudobacteriovorax antillogorgiicola TaxID=1513793 RepID=UPI00190F00E9|nr:hypothetical protein [Pseudobacteriovorax antillogorgiicola]